MGQMAQKVQKSAKNRVCEANAELNPIFLLNTVHFAIFGMEIAYVKRPVYKS